jgi:hypothetical protein
VAGVFAWAHRPGRSSASIDPVNLTLKVVLRVLSMPIGVGVGLGTAQLQTRYICTTFSCPAVTEFPTFALWLCALFGAAAAAITVLASIAVRGTA